MIDIRNISHAPIRRGMLLNLYHKIFNGKDFELSVVILPSRKMQELNKRFRGKNRPADVLSFLLEKNVRGEIFLDGDSPDIVHLFVHGCLHLLGHAHDTLKKARVMEQKEKNIIHGTI